MRKVSSVRKITNPYVKRILSYVSGKDPLKVLSATPGRLRKLTNGLSDVDVRRAPAGGKWSIREIVAHLCDIELVLGFRFRMALSQSGCRLQAMDQDDWARGLEYHKANWKEKLALFNAMRQDHLTLLRSLNARDWKKYGKHEERGKETLEQMVQMLAGHDVNHLKQIEDIRKSSFKRKNW